MGFLRGKIAGRRGRIGFVLILCVPFLFIMGCSTDAVLDAVPAQWNSCYRCLAIGFDQPEVMNEAYYGLGGRAGSLAYWRLCQKVIDGASGSDHVIIVEQLAEEHISQYWYVLIMARADRVTVYTGGTDPFGNIDFGGQVDVGGMAKGSATSVAARHVGADRFRKVLNAMERCRVWEEGDQLYAFAKGEGQIIGQAPVMIHVFRRSDGRTVDFLLAHPVVTPSAIVGRVELDALKDPSLAWFGAPRAVRQEIDPKRQKQRERLFHRSLPARCVLNGALMLLAHPTK